MSSFHQLSQRESRGFIRFYSKPKLSRAKLLYVLVAKCAVTGEPVRVDTAQHTAADREALQRRADRMLDAWVQTEWEECK